MRHWLTALALVGACRAGHRRDDASRSAIPRLPITEDGTAELRALDRRIELHRDDPATETALLLGRASIRGRLEEYQHALALLDRLPDTGEGWQLRVQALTAVHDVAGARAALSHLEPSFRVEPALGLDEATGADVLARREQLATQQPTPTHLTLYAASLAAAGRSEAAIAQIPKAAAAIHDSSPELVAWLLFQWGRLYDQNGDAAIARELYAAARARLPGYVDATSHLAQAMAATGDASGARALVEAALQNDRHPELLALAGDTDEARRAWERYVAALPRAFSDHAARFYLTRDPARALELARADFANRPTREVRALVVEAALAGGDAAAACAVVEPLVTAPLRAHRFMAWRALSSCGRTADADRLAGELGISH